MHEKHILHNIKMSFWKWEAIVTFPPQRLSCTVIRFLPIVWRQKLNWFHICLVLLLVLLHLHRGLHLRFLWTEIKEQSSYLIITTLLHLMSFIIYHPNSSLQMYFFTAQKWSFSSMSPVIKLSCKTSTKLSNSGKCCAYSAHHWFHISLILIIPSQFWSVLAA